MITNPLSMLDRVAPFFKSWERPLIWAGLSAWFPYGLKFGSQQALCNAGTLRRRFEEMDSDGLRWTQMDSDGLRPVRPSTS